MIADQEKRTQPRPGRSAQHLAQSGGGLFGHGPRRQGGRCTSEHLPLCKAVEVDPADMALALPQKGASAWSSRCRPGSRRSGDAVQAAGPPRRLRAAVQAGAGDLPEDSRCGASGRNPAQQSRPGRATATPSLRSGSRSRSANAPPAPIIPTTRCQRTTWPRSTRPRAAPPPLEKLTASGVCNSVRRCLSCSMRQRCS